MNDSLPLIQAPRPPTLEVRAAGAPRPGTASLLPVLMLACIAGALPPRPAAGAAQAPAPAGPAPVAPAVPPGRPAPAAPAVPPAPAGRPAPPTPGAAAEPLPTIGLDEVKIGQRGYGLSVFAGGEPERFDVEVIGVMRNISPDMSYILARLSGRGLESSGVAAGMSGSPVFLDGRLAGAVSFGWPFSKEAICGVTPIALMRNLATLGGPLPITPPPPVELAGLLAGRIPADLLARELARLRPRLGDAPEGALAGVEWSAAGFGELSRGVLRQALGSVAPTGRAAAVPGARPPDLVPGSAVAAVLVSGDFQLAATGTVTDHLGDHILAFGHPFLGIGPIRVPMAAADVVTVLSSQYTSFKITNLGQTVGAFEQDRKAGIEGRLGATAPMIPMVLRIGGAARPAGAGAGAGVGGAAAGAGAAAGGAAAGSPGPRQFRVQLADVPELLPLLAGSTLLAGLESASYAGGPQDIEMVARFRLAPYGDLVIHQSFDGDNAGTAMAGHLLALAAYLVQSPLERVRIEGLEVDVEQSPQPRAASLVAVHADRTLVHPGDRLGIHVELAAYRGARFRHSFQVQLPRDLPAGHYSLLIGDGASADAARLAMAPIEPTNFAQALALLRSLHSRRDLTLLGFYGGAGLSVAGEVMPQLPGSVRSLWSAADTSGAVPLHAAIVQERHELMATPLDGLLRIDLEVRRSEAPEAPAARGAPEASGAAGAVEVSVAPAAPAAPASPTPAAPAAPARPTPAAPAGGGPAVPALPAHATGAP
jgi:SpoIVB peptidase S55